IRPQLLDESGEGLVLRARRRAQEGESDGEDDRQGGETAGEHPCAFVAGRFERAVYTSDTRPPPWRSSRPAISSSKSTVRTIAGRAHDNRTRSSSEAGVGPSR